MFIIATRDSKTVRQANLVEYKHRQSARRGLRNLANCAKAEGREWYFENPSSLWISLFGDWINFHIVVY